jgi:predicted PurR-regulated permease PerM
VPEVVEMKPNTKANIYVVANMITWIIFCVITIVLIFHFVLGGILPILLSIAAVIGLAYFEERILSRVVNRSVAFFLYE